MGSRAKSLTTWHLANGSSMRINKLYNSRYSRNSGRASSITPFNQRSICGPLMALIQHKVFLILYLYTECQIFSLLNVQTDESSGISCCQSPRHNYRKVSKIHIDFPNHQPRQFTVQL